MLRPWLYSRSQSPFPLKELNSLGRGLHSLSLRDRLLKNLQLWCILVLKRGPEFCDYISLVHSNASWAGALEIYFE